MWICPACYQPLSLNNNNWQCELGHSYDRAKEGYVNLLLAQNKRSKEPGDNKEMVQARRDFLLQGYYQPLVEHVATLLKPVIEQQRLRLFDAGCGEGYYLGFIHQHWNKLGVEVQGCGCDVSKVAIQKAAKRLKDCHFAVASSYDLPLPDASQDAVIQVFAPSSADEIARVLRPGGWWIRVNPAPEHLFALKSYLYDEPKHHQLDLVSHPKLASVARSEVSFELPLKDPLSRTALLKMTPYFWSGSEQNKNRFIQSEQPCFAAFDIQVLERLV